MASGDRYTFTYEWTVNDLEARLHNPSDVESPVFSSPEGAQPATKWTLAILSGDCSRESVFGERVVPIDHQYLSIELRRQRALNSTSRAPASQVTSDSSREQSQQQDEDSATVWVEASLKPTITVITKKHSKLFQHTVPVLKCTSRIQRPRKVSLEPKETYIDYEDFNAVLFYQYLETSKVRGSEGVIFKCEIKVWSLDKPVHVTNPSPLLTPSTMKSDFNLGVHMEVARQNDLFTDVTLVADGKEFKAHKVVLASQSQFFKTRFANRWSSPLAVRVEMTDIPAVIMEAILSYMYTGKVEDIENIAYKLLPFAEEYGLIDLRKMCEEVLTRSLTCDTAVSMLMYASAHNASDLKKSCMELIASNIASVKQNEWWGKLKEKQMYHELWVELLEYLHCC